VSAAVLQDKHLRPPITSAVGLLLATYDDATTQNSSKLRYTDGLPDPFRYP